MLILFDKAGLKMNLPVPLCISPAEPRAVQGLAVFRIVTMVLRSLLLRLAMASGV